MATAQDSAVKVGPVLSEHSHETVRSVCAVHVSRYSVPSLQPERPTSQATLPGTAGSETLDPDDQFELDWVTMLVSDQR